MKATFSESAVFFICKTGIYLLLALVIGLLCWTGFRLATLEAYAAISPEEVEQALASASTDAPPLFSGRIQLSVSPLDAEWDERLPFASRKQLEVFVATLNSPQQEELLHNLKKLLQEKSLEVETPENILNAYLPLKRERYDHPPEIWGLPARIVLPVLLATGSLLLIFLLLCIVLLKVERNTR